MRLPTGSSFLGGMWRVRTFCVCALWLGVFLGCSSGPGTETTEKAAPQITTQPTSVSVTVGATATFTVAATGTSPLSYQWQKNQANIGGANSASYTTPATTLADSGSSFDVVVSNGIQPNATSAAATLTVNPLQPSGVNVLTYHNDNARTGQNLNETILTTANVKSNTFGKLANLSVNGNVDAEPLYASNLTVNGSTHKCVVRGDRTGHGLCV